MDNIKKLFLMFLILLIATPLFAEKSLEQRIATRISLIDKTQTETVQKEQEQAICQEEMAVEKEEIDLLMTPITLDIIKLVSMDFKEIQVILGSMSTTEIKRLVLTLYISKDKFTSIKESENIRRILESVQIKQYPIIKFDFFEATNDDTSILWVDCNAWVDINEMQNNVRTGNYKLVAFMSEWKNNATIIETGGTTNDYKPNIRESFEIPYMAVKTINPNIPVGFIVVLDPNAQIWLNSFTIQPDAWLLFNVPTFGANWNKIKEKWFKNRVVMTNLNHHFQYHNYGKQEYGSVEYINIINTLQSLGYAGNIYWR